MQSVPNHQYPLCLYIHLKMYCIASACHLNTDIDLGRQNNKDQKKYSLYPTTKKDDLAINKEQELCTCGKNLPCVNNIEILPPKMCQRNLSCTKEEVVMDFTWETMFEDACQVFPEAAALPLCSQ